MLYCSLNCLRLPRYLSTYVLFEGPGKRVRFHFSTRRYAGTYMETVVTVHRAILLYS